MSVNRISAVAATECTPSNDGFLSMLSKFLQALLNLSGSLVMSGQHFYSSYVCDFAKFVFLLLCCHAPQHVDWVRPLFPNGVPGWEFCQGEEGRPVGRFELPP